VSTADVHSGPTPAFHPVRMMPSARPACQMYEPARALLEQLGRLKEQGLLTDEKYEAKKKQVLGI
jgi:hypothetical protein